MMHTAINLNDLNNWNDHHDLKLLEKTKQISPKLKETHLKHPPSDA